MRDVYLLEMGELPMELEGVFVSPEAAMHYREGFSAERKAEPFKIITEPVRDKEIEVVVWVREHVYLKRELTINCSVEEAKKMSSDEFHDRIVDWGDVRDEESCVDAPEYELDEIYEYE